MKSGIFCLGIVGSLVTFTIAQSGQAQLVVTDGTLNTNVTRSGNSFTITGGNTAGTNLFHSFQEFSIPTGGAAFFDNATSVQNIFSRVTGGAISNIDGIIRANGTANLFLLNPNGILFGANAQLNLGGSFLGSTAQAIQFADGTTLNATDATNAPLLTMSAPVGLQFGRTPATIQVQGRQMAPAIDNTAPIPPIAPSGLQVVPGQTLALVGGDITLDGGEVTTWGGRIELGSIRGVATVPMLSTPTGFTFNYSEIPLLGNIHLARRALVSVGSGSTQIQAQTLRLTAGSVILAQNFGAQPGGELLIRANDRVALDGVMPDGSGRSAIVSEVYGTGKGGDITLSTRQLALNDGATLSLRTYSSAATGKLLINASESLVAQGFRPSNPNEVVTIATGAFINGQLGNVTVNTPFLSLRDGAVISSVNFGLSTGGDLHINTQTTEISGSSPTLFNSGISSTNLGTGAAGTVTLNTGRLQISNGGAIGSSSINDGRAGNITVRATESIQVAGRFAQLPSTISSSVYPAPAFFQSLFGLPPIPQGRAGEVTITTPDLRISDGANLSVANFGLGDAGNLRVNANSLSLDQAGKIEAATFFGKGGNIILQSDLLKLRNLSQITTTASSSGNGGNIAIDAPIIVGLGNSDIVANAIQGNGGDINITTQGIIGLVFRNTPTPRLDSTNDITASGSSVNGTVQIKNLGGNVDAGLIELPTNLIDSAQQVAQGCSSNRDSSFIITGRGGNPNNPQDTMLNFPTWKDFRPVSQARPADRIASTSVLVEAMKWQQDPSGKIQLMAEQSPRSPQLTTCIKPASQ
jgi:filamentous hemagglutinin family protein